MSEIDFDAFDVPEDAYAYEIWKRDEHVKDLQTKLAAAERMLIVAEHYVPNDRLGEYIAKKRLAAQEPADG